MLIQKAKSFKGSLEWAIRRQMLDAPERFHRSVLRDRRYPGTFSAHMIQKLREKRVLVINDTVAMALRRLNQPSDVDALYAFLGLQGPAEPKPKAKKKTVRKGVSKAVKKALKEISTRDTNYDFRGC